MWKSLFLAFLLFVAIASLIKLNVAITIFLIVIVLILM